MKQQRDCHILRDALDYDPQQNSNMEVQINQGKMIKLDYYIL